MTRKEKRATMLRLVEAWKESGLTQTEFALKNNVAPSKFKYWIGKSNQSTHDDFSADFIQIPASPINFGSQEKEIRLHYPNGTWMSLPVDTPVAVLKTLVVL